MKHVILEELIKKLITLPLFIGNHPDNNEPIYLNLGQYRFYVTNNKNYASIKSLDPFNTSLDEALILLEKNLEKIKKNSAEIDLDELLGKHKEAFAPITCQQLLYNMLYYAENIHLLYKNYTLMM